MGGGETFSDQIHVLTGRGHIHHVFQVLRIGLSMFFNMYKAEKLSIQTTIEYPKFFTHSKKRIYFELIFITKTLKLIFHKIRKQIKVSTYIKNTIKLLKLNWRFVINLKID